MRILLLILTMTLLSGATDIYIYRRVIRRRFGIRGRGVYIAVCLLLDLLVAGGLLWLRYGPGDAPIMLMMWLLAIFFAHAGPSIIYVIFSLPGGRLFHRFGAVLGLVMLGMMVGGMSFGRTSIRVEQVEILSEQLPEAFDGLRVVQFSDLHLGTLSGEEQFVERLVRKINGLRPDIVVQSGDIVNTHAGEMGEQIMEQLARIEAPEGVFAAIGNHDLGFYMSDDSPITPAESLEALIGKQEQMGWNVLVNRTEWLRRGTDSIAVTGLGFMARDPSPQHQLGNYTAADMGVYDAVPEQAYDLTIAHTPNQWEEIRATGRADLTLSGHTHAMQMKFFGWSAAKWMYRHWSGLYETDGQLLYVNDGLGCVMYPMRVNVRPELTLFILRRP